LETAVSLDKIIETDALQIGVGDIPVHDSLLLDSIQALSDGDNRRSLIYAAVAVETFVSSSIDAFFDRTLGGDAAPTHLRVQKFTLPGGAEHRKDPVHSYLRTRSKVDFSLLIHELPLYVLNRSLLADDEGLYRDAIKLHRTRNQLVHKGLIDAADRQDLFQTDYQGAHGGVETAIKICRWFGMIEDYVLPGGGRIEMIRPAITPEYAAPP
jgi:hypothetical protein